MKFHSVKSNARRDARKQFGADAVQGVDYELVSGPDGYAVRAIVKTPPATKARPARQARAKAEPKRKRPVGPRKITKVAKGKARSDKPVATGGGWSDQLLAMLARPQGATAAEVGAAFGWLEHTSRARISVTPRARNARAERTREERNGKTVSVYRLATELPLNQKREELGVRYVKPAAKARKAA